MNPKLWQKSFLTYLKYQGSIPGNVTIITTRGPTEPNARLFSQFKITVKSFIFVGTKFRGFPILDNIVGTNNRGFAYFLL